MLSYLITLSDFKWDFVFNVVHDTRNDSILNDVAFLFKLLKKKLAKHEADSYYGLIL